MWACGPWGRMYFWSLPGWIKDGRMGAGGKGMEVLSWLVYCQTASGLLVLTDVWCWHSCWWGSCTAPSWDTDKGLSSSSCFSPSASAFPGIYLLYMDSLSGSSIILPGPLGQKSKQFQANSRNLEYIWSTGKKKLARPFPWQTLDAQAYPSPAVSWLSQHRLAFFRMSQALVHCVPKTKIKVSQWFHWYSLSIMWQTSPHLLQRKHFRRLCSLEKTSLNPISSPFLYPQCEWEASIRTFFSLVFAGFCFLELRSNFQFHILIDIPW